MTDPTKGFLALFAANVIWGLSPIFYKQLAHIPALELLSHRTVWSLVFFGAVLVMQARLMELPRAVRGRQAALKLVLSAVFISMNWGLFIWAIQVERAVEVSLGYYVFPLVSVAIGILVFREGWQLGTLIAVPLATAAVVILSYGLGAAPWVAIVLAVSFAFYSAIKKTTATSPIVSVTAEVVILAPPAVIWLFLVHRAGGGSFGLNALDTVLLICSGPLTAAPLILFSYASRRLRLATLGLVQYLNPTLQFMVAVLIFAEPFTRWHAIALPLIWVALAIYSLDMVVRERAARRAKTKSSTS